MNSLVAGPSDEGQASSRRRLAAARAPLFEPRGIGSWFLSLALLVAWCLWLPVGYATGDDPETRPKKATAAVEPDQVENQRPAGSDALEAGDTTEPVGPTMTRRQTLMASLTIFVLAIFVGFEVITKVPPTLHTPLMSGSNAISGITVVGAILVAGSAAGISSWLGWLAVVFASINVVGGFLVTHRMLAMFRRK